MIGSLILVFIFLVGVTISAGACIFVGEKTESITAVLVIFIFSMFMFISALLIIGFELKSQGLL